jgi:hypothetical protein
MTLPMAASVLAYYLMPYYQVCPVFAVSLERCKQRMHLHCVMLQKQTTSYYEKSCKNST